MTIVKEFFALLGFFALCLYGLPLAVEIGHALLQSHLGLG